MIFPNHCQNVKSLSCHKVVLKGKPDKAVFPDICVSCANPAVILEERAEVFSHSDCEGGIVYEVITIRVPLCGHCHEQHQCEKPARGLIWRIGLLFHSWQVLALIGSLGTTLFFVHQGLLTPPNMLFGLNAPWWFSFFFGSLFLWILRGTWRNTAYLAAPEPSSVTRSVGISDNEAALFQRRRHTFYFTHPHVADSFMALNKAKLVKISNTD